MSDASANDRVVSEFDTVQNRDTCLESSHVLESTRTQRASDRLQYGAVDTELRWVPQAASERDCNGLKRDWVTMLDALDDCDFGNFEKALANLAPLQDPGWAVSPRGWMRLIELVLSRSAGNVAARSDLDNSESALTRHRRSRRQLSLAANLHRAFVKAQNNGVCPAAVYGLDYGTLLEARLAHAIYNDARNASMLDIGDPLRDMLSPDLAELVRCLHEPSDSTYRLITEMQRNLNGLDSEWLEFEFTKNWIIEGMARRDRGSRTKSAAPRRQEFLA